MKIKILPETPLSPLNTLFPEGVPVVDSLEFRFLSSTAYLFDPTQVSKDILCRMKNLFDTDEELQLVSPILVRNDFCPNENPYIAIPKDWVCTDEQSTTAS